MHAGEASHLIANMGSPMMWFSGCHLIFLNAAIGWYEGSAIDRRLQEPTQQWVPLLIVANYLSAIIGLLALEPALWQLAAIFGGRDWAAGLLPALVAIPIATLLGSLVVEGLFVISACARKAAKARRALAAFAVAQLITHAMVMLVFAATSDISVATAVRWKTGTGFDGAIPSQTWVYYLTSDGQRVLRCSLDGRTREFVEHVHAIPAAADDTFIGYTPLLHAAPIDPDTTVLNGDACSLRIAGGRNRHERVLETPLSGRAGLFFRSGSPEPGRPAHDHDFTRSWAAAIVSSDDGPRPDARLAGGLFPGSAIRCEPRFWVGMQTAVGRARFQHVTIIQGRYCIAEMQGGPLPPLIVAFDMSTGEARVLAQGRSPVVVWQLPPPAPAATAAPPPPSHAGP